MPNKIKISDSTVIMVIQWKFAEVQKELFVYFHIEISIPYFPEEVLWRIKPFRLSNSRETLFMIEVFLLLFWESQLILVWDKPNKGKYTFANTKNRILSESLRRRHPVREPQKRKGSFLKVHQGPNFWKRLTFENSIISWAELLFKLLNNSLRGSLRPFRR